MDSAPTEPILDEEADDLKSSHHTEDNDSKRHSHSGDGASPGKIFIGGLARETTIAQFIKHFGKYGEITDSVIMKDRKTGQPCGFGFVTYADPSVVDQVIQETHVINDKQVEIKRTIPKGAIGAKDFKTKKIFVGGIPATVTEDPYSNATVSSPRKRPPGRKAAKESRQKSKASLTDTSNSISDTIRELSEQSEKRKNFYEEQKLQLLKEQADREDVQLEIARRAEDRMQKEQDRLQMIADDAIMEKDTSHMSVEQQHYYQLRKNAIMAKAMKNASNSNFNVLPDY